MTLNVGQLYAEYQGAIFGYLWRRTGDRELSADLAQQVWVNVLRRADQYDERGRPISAWLYRIAANLLVDHIRQRHRPLPLPLDVVHDRPVTDAGSDLHADQLTAGATVAWALAESGLTPLHQSVIRCRFFEGRTPGETGQAIGITTDAAKKLQWRALARMRRALLERRAS